MLEVSTAADKTALTTVKAVKDQLNIVGTDEDDFIAKAIAQATDDICGYLNIRRAQDATRTVALETLVETFMPGRMHSHRRIHYYSNRRSVVLARWPVKQVITVVAGTTTLDPTEYQCSVSGVLERLSSDRVIGWPDLKIVVTYKAGWVMPEETEGRDLPESIEGAAIDYISAMRSGRTRDPLVKSESVPGVGDTDYWVGTIGDDGAIPPSVTSRLDRFRRISIG